VLAQELSQPARRLVNFRGNFRQGVESRHFISVLSARYLRNLGIGASVAVSSCPLVSENHQPGSVLRATDGIQPWNTGMWKGYGRPHVRPRPRPTSSQAASCVRPRPQNL
jgi:hypothetical protein